MPVGGAGLGVQVFELLLNLLLELGGGFCTAVLALNEKIILELSSVSVPQIGLYEATDTYNSTVAIKNTNNEWRTPLLDVSFGSPPMDVLTLPKPVLELSSPVQKP